MNNIKEKWNLKLLYKSDNDPKIEGDMRRDEIKTERFVKRWRNNKKYLNSSQTLKKALDEYEKMRRDSGFERTAYYFSLRYALDQGNHRVRAKLEQVEERMVKDRNKTQFFILELGKIPLNKQAAFLRDKNLLPYQYWLKEMWALAKYDLSEAEEKIMSLKAGPAHNHWISMTERILSEEKKEVLDKNKKKAIKNFAEIMSLISNQDKKVRDKAAETINEILRRWKKVAESEINAILTNKKVDDELRKIETPEKSRHLADGIKSRTVEAMVRAVEKNFEIARQFYSLKAKILGVKKLKYHERNLSVIKEEKEYSYAESLELLRKVFKNLDQEFADMFELFIRQRQIDVWPKEGKSDGAFCAHGNLNDTVYLLLNHTNKLRDTTTLAHEMGHAINNELMKKERHGLDFGTTLATAEVASTFMEDFVLEELFKNIKEDARLGLMVEKLNDDVSTIFRQVACYRFEQELHRTFRVRGYLAAEEIGKIFKKHMKDYMGESVEQSAGAENWWIYWSHIRRFFYNYSYASGLLISKALQKKTRANPEFISKVKKFLAAGLSDSPENIFKDIGLDITKESFWEEGLKEVAELLKETKRMAKIVA